MGWMVAPASSSIRHHEGDQWVTGLICSCGHSLLSGYFTSRRMRSAAYTIDWAKNRQEIRRVTDLHCSTASYIVNPRKTGDVQYKIRPRVCAFAMKLYSPHTALFG